MLEMPNYNIKSKDIQLKFKGSVWEDIWKAWTNVNFHQPDLINQILNQIIWFNSHIQINNKIIQNSIIRMAGVKTILDIYLVKEKKI